MFSLSQCIYEEGYDDGKEKWIQYLINVVKELGGTMETAVHQLITKYGLEEIYAQEQVKRYW